jgi:hypothetical protein
METTRQMGTDLAKAALPIGGGVALTVVEWADRWLTLGTHFVGFVSGCVGLAWLCYRVYRDLRSVNKKRRG